MIPESFKQDLLRRIDIVELIERYVPLRKGGANYLACCPFHSEKTPSFTVSPTKQFYHCFGCGAHGNAIGFLMEYQGLGYVDAMKQLAESVGMKLPEFQPGPARPAGPDLGEMLERAARFYREQLKRSQRAIEYLKGRGLTGQIAARFGIGYAPDAWQALQSVFTDYGGKALKDAGLVIDGENGRRYDRFRDRIMFPILNQRGTVIGFGGRVIGQGEPKYLNSPETPLFEKGRELYGLSLARAGIRAKGRVVVVEGYMDVVALAQHGVENAVATLGTATTPAHIQKLFRQTDEIVFCFDGDAAGRRAAWHALEVALPLLADDKAVRFLFLPAGDDPDSFVRSRGAEAFERALAGARPLSEFLLAELRGRADMDSMEGRSRLVAEAKPLLARIGAPALQLQLAREVCEAARIAPENFARLTGIRVGRPPAAQPVRPPAPLKARSVLDGKLERELLGCLIVAPELAKSMELEVLDPSQPWDRVLLEVTSFLLGAALEDDAAAPIYPLLLDRFSADPALGLIREAAQWAEENRIDRDIAAVDFAAALAKRRDRLDRRRHAELMELIARGDASPQHVEEFKRLSERRARGGIAAGSAMDTG